MNLMNLEEAKLQLLSLKEDRKSFIENDEEHDEEFLKDIQAIEIVLEELENRIPKKKLEDILQNKFVSFFEGNAEIPDEATEMKLVRYVKYDIIKELLEDK